MLQTEQTQSQGTKVELLQERRLTCMGRVSTCRLLQDLCSDCVAAARYWMGLEACPWVPSLCPHWPPKTAA